MSLNSISVTSLAAAAILAAASPVGAQACASPGNCNLTPGGSSLVVGGKSGYKTQVWISVLGGASSAATQMYQFLAPLNGAGKFTWPLAVANKVAIGPAKPATGSKPWVAPANSTSLGLYHPGDEIFLGILTRGSQWWASGPGSRFDTQRAMLNHWGSTPILADNRTSQLERTGTGDVYGWEDRGGAYPSSDRDFNDFYFSVNQSVVTPEPASMILLGTGLAGVAGVVRRRKQKRDA